MNKSLLLILVIFGLTLIGNRASAQSAAHDSSAVAVQVSVSPNPFEDQVTLYITHGPSTNLTVLRIFDAIGKELFVHDLSTHRGNNAQVTLDFGSLKPGVYFCSLYSDKGLVDTRKVYKSR